jgi:hypothetical protein
MSPAEDLPPEQPGQPGPQQPGEPGPEQPGRTGPEHPTNGLDETVHQRHRLGILTITGEAQRAEFGYLREALGLTPGNLSKHLTVLEQAGMVEVEKGAGRGPGSASPPRAAPRSPPSSPPSPNSSAGTPRLPRPEPTARPVHWSAARPGGEAAPSRRGSGPT